MNSHVSSLIHAVVTQSTHKHFLPSVYVLVTSEMTRQTEGGATIFTGVWLVS